MDETGILEFTSPATGERFGEVPVASQEQVQQAMQEMRLASQEWAGKTPGERARILGELQKVLIDSLDEITAILTKNTGKSRQDALIEIFMTIEFLHSNRRQAPRWLRRRRVSHGVQFFKSCYVEQSPFGVVLVIAPWNYPFFLSMPPVLAALLAGNTVILKPSEVAAGVGVIMEELFQKVPELAPYVRILHGDGAVGAALVEAGPDFIFVTGSTQTGREVLKAAARNLTPAAFELGGKDAMIVLDDADLDKAAYWGVWGALYNAGQSCVAVDRVYVVEKVYAEFIDKAVRNIRQFQVGFSEALECPYTLGPIADPRQIEIIERQLGDATIKGARIVAGGKRDGMFVEPTIVEHVTHDMLLMQEETFGPVLPVMMVKDEAQAIQLANDSPYGLSATVWSQDLDRAWRVARQIRAGVVIVNDTLVQFGIPMLPIGGQRQSGYGRIHGKEGLLQFTQPKGYVVGKPPADWDITTLLRKPGHYRLAALITHLLFGMTPGRRLRPLLSRNKPQASSQPGERQAMPH